MSTRSYIGILEGTEVKYIYCHFDGYLKGVGAMLEEHYKDEAKVKELISKGGMSYIAPNINPTKEHSFDKPQKDVCVFYHRDRREIEHIHRIDVKRFNPEILGEICYLYDEGKWYSIGMEKKLLSELL